MSADQKTGIENSSFKSYYDMLGFNPTWIEEIIKEAEDINNY